MSRKRRTPNLQKQPYIHTNLHLCLHLYLYLYLSPIYRNRAECLSKCTSLQKKQSSGVGSPPVAAPLPSLNCFDSLSCCVSSWSREVMSKILAEIAQNCLQQCWMFGCPGPRRSCFKCGSRMYKYFPAQCTCHSLVPTASKSP